MAHADDETGRPTPKMVRLYHALADRLGGEPADLWLYRGVGPPRAAGLPAEESFYHVLVWPADDELEMTTVNTLGMSNRPVPGTSYFAELHFAVRAYLRENQREELARFLAGVAESVFDTGLTINWWDVLPAPGPVPHFPNCPHLLLHPKFTDEGFDSLDDVDGAVRLFYVVPVTDHERTLLTEHGRGAFEEYIESNDIDLFADRTDPP